MSQVAEFFNQLTSKVDPAKIKGMNVTYQFVITGEGGGEWAVAVSNEQLTVTEGKAEKANITLTISASDFLDLVAGKLNGQTAFLTGKLKIQGDMTLALKLQSVFNLG
ncbi:MAG TPA: SCP2 sterol-binding domain-containing protein [Candidatus Hydrogenedens sp.]|nr:SCP2 sterol-binding domain-containing protein [Candidatus Hydrogenedens sp.]HOK08374.1 SCP2 sterol-binding domain-containing protein [Candidatus Hydrogenedens sp.]HOL20576.1 SCP2 sterol-binding domain-containing protein [Candidatus Hydrogenedens sp.]HPP57668.1 SCP2 sterol-binding domain-containing protein [Candidatus Hydrogenedens sp.]